MLPPTAHEIAIETGAVGAGGKSHGRRAMPPYSEQILSSGDLADIHAYVASLPPPPDYKSIPLLSQ